MKRVKYLAKVRTEEGDIVEETREAADRYALYEAVKADGMELVSVEEIKKRMTVDDLLGKFSRFSATERIMFAGNLSTMVQAGLPLSRALSVMVKQSRNQKFKATVSAIQEEIKKGTPFHEALGKFPKIFNNLFVAMVRAGEESGKLTESLAVISSQLEKANQLKKKIKGAMIYPSIVIFAMAIVGVLMLIFIVPTLTSTFTELGVELPASTQAVITVSNLLKHNTVAVLVGLVALIVGLMRALKTKTGRRVRDAIVLKIPLIKGIYKEAQAATTARTLSSLLASGVDVIAALGITKDVLQSDFYKAVVEEAQDGVAKGQPMSKPFIAHDNLYPIFVGEMMAVGEETGKISEMLGNLAVYYEDEVSQKTKDMSTIIEPFLMLIVGAAVGFFAISMISPMYSLVDAF